MIPIAGPRFGLRADGLPAVVPKIESKTVIRVDHQAPFALIRRIDVLGYDHLLATIQRVDVDPSGDAEGGARKRDRVGWGDRHVIAHAVQLQGVPLDAGNQLRSPDDLSRQRAGTFRNAARIDGLERPRRDCRDLGTSRWLTRCGRSDDKQHKQEGTGGRRILGKPPWHDASPRWFWFWFWFRRCRKRSLVGVQPWGRNARLKPGVQQRVAIAA
jgi:hypothetical protein